MAFTVYTRDELRDIILAHIRGRVPGANTAYGSDYYLLAAAIATAVHGDQAAAQFLVQQILPSTATSKWLEAHAALRGLEKQQPSKSRGKLLVRASALTSIPAGQALTHAGGQTYVVTASAIAALPSWSSRTVAPGSTRSRLVLNANAASISVDDLLAVSGFSAAAVKAVIPDTGTPVAVDLYAPLASVPGSGVAVAPTAGVVLEVEATAVGADGNLDVGDTLPFDVVPAGVTGTPVVLEMTGGGDLETEEELRGRVMAWLQERPGGGNRSDFREWARATPNVRLADAFVYPSYRGLGSVDVVPFGVGGARITGLAVNELVEAHLLDEAASFADDVLVRQLTESAVNVDVRVRVGLGYEPDWAGFVQLHGTQVDLDKIRLLSASTEIEVGDRVLIQAGDKAPRLFQREVVGIETGPDRLVLDEALPSLPTASSNVYPGGPTAQAVIDAVVSLFDDLGPGDTDPASRFPSPATAHSDELSLAVITATLQGVEGVIDSAIIAPATDQFPATLVRLALGQLTVRLTTSFV